jgi:uncharacterized protein (TIGR03435 family)
MGKFAIIVLIASAAAAQRPTFEVASIKRYAPGAVVAPGTGGFKLSPDGSLIASYTTLRMFIQWAYGVPGDISGPPWLDEERYDVAAKAAAPATFRQFKLMFQSLLEDRFKLKVRTETKDLPTVVLVLAKGGTKGLDPTEDGGKFEVQRANGILTIKNASMASIANLLGSPLGNMPLERVIDQTGLPGLYNIALDLRHFDRTDPAFAGNYPEMRSSLRLFVSDALERQYGLKLDQRKVPLESLVVESCSKDPTAN